MHSCTGIYIDNSAPPLHIWGHVPRPSRIRRPWSVYSARSAAVWRGASALVSISEVAVAVRRARLMPGWATVVVVVLVASLLTNIDTRNGSTLKYRG